MNLLSEITHVLMYNIFILTQLLHLMGFVYHGHTGFCPGFANSLIPWYDILFFPDYFISLSPDWKSDHRPSEFNKAFNMKKKKKKD